MTTQEMRDDMKRPRYKSITLEVIGALGALEHFPYCGEFETLHAYLDRLKAKQVSLLYSEVCNGVSLACHLGIEDQYGLHLPDEEGYESAQEAKHAKQANKVIRGLKRARAAKKESS